MTVVVGLFDTAEGRSAVRAALAEAARREVELVVVHAQGAPDGPLEDVRTEASSRGVSLDVVEPAAGEDLASAIVGVAAGRGAERVVIGLRRRSPVGKLILGAGAQRVLLDAPCPVLAVKPGGSPVA